MMYKQLTQSVRYQINGYMRIGMIQTEIEREIRVHRSTIIREIKRNTGKRGYRPKQAEEKRAPQKKKRKNKTGRMGNHRKV